MPDYSGTPLVKKLGIKNGMHLTVLGAPPGYKSWLEELPATGIGSTLPKAAEAVHVFETSCNALARTLARLRRSIDPAGFVWVSWPKKSSGVPTDIMEHAVREVALPLGFVDIKVCAVTDT